MWTEPETYLILAILVMAALLTYRIWGDGVYVISRHWNIIAYVLVLGLAGTLAVYKQQEFKYNLVYSYFTKSEPKDTREARYQIRQCKEFVQAKLNGQQVEEFRQISAGPVPISKISYWDYCAKTFGLNFWKYDTSIDGKDGGRVLCDAYARDSYRSSKVQSWCDTVFAPNSATDRKV